MCFAVDDDVVEKLLGLLSEVDMSQNAKTEFSLKAVAGLLYRQQQCRLDSDSENSHDVPDDTSEPCPPQVSPDTAASLVSLTADLNCESQVPVCRSGFPISTTASVDKSRNTVADCAVTKCERRSVDSNAERPTWNVRHLSNAGMPVSSPTVPYFCIPTVPVGSSSLASLHGGRRLNEHVCYEVNDMKTYNSPAVSPVTGAGACNSPAISLKDSQNVSPCLWTSLPYCSSAAVRSMPSVSSSQQVLSGDRSGLLLQTIHSPYSSRTLTTTDEAVSRVSDLLASQCKVLVLMRGCPGSGKSTVAMYVVQSKLS